MRIVKELQIDGIRISVFSWNNKYLIKFEQGMVEQTFKINAMDLGSEEDLLMFLEKGFLEKVQKMMDEMHQILRNELENI